MGLEIDKEFDEDLGLEFENSLMSEYRSCCNKCIFVLLTKCRRECEKHCILRMMIQDFHFARKLYYDDKYERKDIDRIIRMHLSPINISVQTTNPELRCKMLNNRFAGEKLKYLQRFTMVMCR